MNSNHSLNVNHSDGSDLGGFCLKRENIVGGFRTELIKGGYIRDFNANFSSFHLSSHTNLFHFTAPWLVIRILSMLLWQSTWPFFSYLFRWWARRRRRSCARSAGTWTSCASARPTPSRPPSPSMSRRRSRRSWTISRRRSTTSSGRPGTRWPLPASSAPSSSWEGATGSAVLIYWNTFSWISPVLSFD